jgi:hypothetical protein
MRIKGHTEIKDFHTCTLVCMKHFTVKRTKILVEKLIPRKLVKYPSSELLYITLL